jgi:hypothetical protein
MGSSTIPVAGGKTRFVLTLTSGTSWTVPSGVTYVNVTLQGGGAGNYFSTTTNGSPEGRPGQMVSSTLTTTPGASISYSIGAGGTGGGTSTPSGAGGTTTFTGATSATGGAGSSSYVGTAQAGFSNGAPQSSSATYAGGAGRIDVEYWV